MTVPPRVFATDFDGTLLRSDGTISQRTARAIVAAEAAGCVVIVATARPPRWMDPFAQQVGSHGLVLCTNGAFVLDLHAGAVVEEHTMSLEAALEVADRLRTALPGTAFGVEGRSGLGAEPSLLDLRGPGGEQVTDARRVAPLEELLADELPGKLLARHDSLTGDEFIARATAVVGDLAHLAYSGAPGLAEMTAPGVTKATALQRWCRERDIDAADVWTFGDMPNDVPMLAWAGRGYAVANAHPDAVAAASHRCPANDEDGVAEVIEAALRR
ncbi:HAD family hydrolase [Arsenicicoccus sp. oral taxon 190]|uniref:HAD family hydrolase n=1 Tax=Arsenicicoccus sp. oral taxon 190 TaxID=1658671 RepID=UPI000679F20E|nr:HAD family hydrolase [Arsenicicoccus sp. oral taxon 190]AKT50508.1 hypothetical protein ADJ73_02830 [Arsenicicoccus sp. oral taxon 190]